MHTIKTSLPKTLDSLQFANSPNRSLDDAISSTLHLALTHLENKDSYVRIRGGKSTQIFYSSKSTITLLNFYLGTSKSTSKSTSLKIYSSKSKK